ncbi:MAG: IS200/IS605 family transposase [Bacteroidota bacterium]
MSTYTQIIYQIVFGTKYRIHALTQPNRAEMFKYMANIIRNRNCHLYQINGVEDHIHIILSLHPSISLASFVKDIKVSSSIFIKEKKLFKDFCGWQVGYGAFTYNIKEKHKMIQYVINQEHHHRTISYREEYTDLLNEHGIDFNEQYLW